MGIFWRCQNKEITSAWKSFSGEGEGKKKEGKTLETHQHSDERISSFWWTKIKFLENWLRVAPPPPSALFAVLIFRWGKSVKSEKFSLPNRVGVILHKTLPFARRVPLHETNLCQRHSISEFGWKASVWSKVDKTSSMVCCISMQMCVPWIGQEMSRAIFVFFCLNDNFSPSFRNRMDQFVY